MSSSFRSTSKHPGATKAAYLDDAAGCFDVDLKDDDIKYLEQLYLPHKIVGAL